MAADRYLHGFPTGGNNLTLVVLCAGVGLLLGLRAMVTSVHARPDGTPVAKAGPFAVLLWIVGTGSRLAFALYATNGGGPTIARLSRTYHVDSRTAITTALILMAMAEVVGRYGLLALRAWSVRSRGGPPSPNRLGAERAEPARRYH